MISGRWKIIIIVTVFNLLFEYSLRGFNNLHSLRFLPIILLMIYFPLFTMLEDLIVRFRLKDWQLILLSFFYGTIYDAYASGILFINPKGFGVSWVSLILINLIWWGVLQTVLGFYLANAISPRDWTHATLSKGGWFLCIFINLIALMLFRKFGGIPLGTPIGNLTVLVVAFISLMVFLRTIKKNDVREAIFKKDKFISLICAVTVFAFLFSALVLTKDPIKSNTSYVNASGLKFVTAYTAGLFFVFLGYKITTKKSISV